MMQKLNRGFNLIIVFCLFVAALVVLAVSSVTTIYYDMHCENDWPKYGRENIPLLLLFVVLVFATLWLMNKMQLFERSKLLLVIVLGVITAYCLMLILVIHPQAVNDSKMIDDIINQFAKGDYSSLTEKGGYLYIWPFQLGYVGFGQIMHRLFGESNYFAWDIVQLISILITIYLLYQITWELFKDETVCGIMAVISCGALFFYNFVTYIYGDIISMAPQTLALYFMILFVKKEKIWHVLLSAISIAVAVLIKTNCEIALIAIVMMLMISGIQLRHKQQVILRLVLAVIIIAMTFGAKHAVDAYYCRVTGLDAIPAGSPSWSHIAMGLQESELEDGWYNRYNYDVFAENGYDTDATAAAAKKNILETLTTFVHRPLHGLKFFARKFTTQWADSVCISTHDLDLVSRHVDIESPFRDYLVFGSDKGNPALIWIMNVFMPVCYIGVAVYLFGILKGRAVSHQEMLILILIFGGIVFHEFWEGSSRYAMRYYIYWLPYAAYGIKVILNAIPLRKAK
ncbi:MAG: glycosyltransferase family 39 protein [Butyrivibrio sp.]|nr:glycosyltransferase family 39 protein [Butyrivibrio sp.]